MRSGLLLACVTVSALVVTGCGKDPEVAKREYLQSGDRFAAEGKLNEAAIEYRNAIQQDPRFGEARLKLAEIFVKNGNPAGAYREYVRAADLMPGDAEVQLKAAAFNMAAEQFEDAKVRAERILEYAPDNVEARVLIANALAGLRQMDAAIEAMQRALTAAPTKSQYHANLGALYLMAGQPQEAERAYRRGADVEPDSARAHTELASFLARNGRRSEAEEALERALAIDPKDLFANRQLATLYLSTNRIAEAEDPLRALADASGDVSLRMMLADYFRLYDRIPEAMVVLGALEADPKGFASANTLKAVIFFQQGNLPEAHAAVDAALSKEPENFEALLVKADLLARERRLEDALTIAETAARVGGGSADAHRMVGRIRGDLGQMDGAIAAFKDALALDQSVPVQLDLALAYLRTGRPRDALDMSQGVVNVQPDNPAALLVQARSYLILGELDAAQRPLSRLARNHEDVPAVQVQLGDWHRLKGEAAAARVAYQRALTLAPDNVPALSGLAKLDLRAGKPQNARASIEAAVAKQPKSPELLLVAGRAYLEQRDYPAAERALRQVIELDATIGETYNLLGQVYAAQGQIDRAVREFDRLVELSPKPASVHTLIGILLESQKNLDAARARYETALSIEADQPVAANNLAWLIAEHGGNLDVALQLAQAAKARLPESAAVTDTLGWVYYKKGLFTQATAAFQESVAKEPDVSAFHYHLGLSLAKNGDVGRARVSLENAVRLEPQGSHADAARAALTSLADKS